MLLFIGQEPGSNFWYQNDINIHTYFLAINNSIVVQE